MPSTDDIRTAFLDYLARNGHEVVPSSPLVPRNDPTLLFTNAGMVQFKGVFTGVEKRPYRRAATAQKCLRAGGKHNDLENVGYTARHHTFFEMLGNFSFGDYFKDTAIELAWNLITREFGVAKSRLLVTVYAEDEEARSLWAKIAGLPEKRIIRIATADNFWAMGELGPCGPCSEIFYDHGESLEGGPPGSAEDDGDRFVEIWNLVFMQYEQVSREERVALPSPSIDTGMGLERIAAVLQGKHDNYDIDLFRALIAASAEISGVAPDGAHAVSHRVIADHLRAAAFLLADGVLPGREGRGYVLRRIMRRAMRHARMLGQKQPFLWRLVPSLLRAMGGAYPELARAEALITETLRFEEGNFAETLERGLRLLEEETQRLEAGAPLPGQVAFRLYDTYGFPLDLTEDVLRAEGRKVALEGFEEAMARQREEARKSWVGSGEAQSQRLWFALREELGATEFLGYESLNAEGIVLALLREGLRVAEASAGEEVAFIVNQTPFYGEAGGQEGDSGIAFSASGAELEVRDTVRRAGELYLHLATLRRGTIKPGDALELRVEGARRVQLRANHSATHLLHRALRGRLGAHVTQKGSLVAADRLRFDFSHAKALSGEEIAAVEAEVNERIRANGAVSTRLLSPERAVAEGALALFGEKYGEEVRVVAMGRAEGEDNPYSVELCGGTHVRRTGDIGFFKIVAETAVASGVRRIEALTGKAAEAYLAEEEGWLREAAAALRSPPPELPARVEALIAERRRLEHELQEARRLLARSAPASRPAAKRIGEVSFDGRVIEDVPARELKSLADELKGGIGSGVLALVSRAGGKASVVVAVSADLLRRFDAVELARLAAGALGGKGGGGRADMAQAGGPDGARAEEALAVIERAIAEKLRVEA